MEEIKPNIPRANQLLRIFWRKLLKAIAIVLSGTFLAVTFIAALALLSTIWVFQWFKTDLEARFPSPDDEK
jgi:ABC-type phosphate/phosphonate transport system permease subunit